MTEVASKYNDLDENSNVSKSVSRRLFTESRTKRITTRTDSDGNEICEVQEFSSINDGESGSGSSAAGNEQNRAILSRQDVETTGGYDVMNSHHSSSSQPMSYLPQENSYEELVSKKREESYETASQGSGSRRLSDDSLHTKLQRQDTPRPKEDWYKEETQRSPYGLDKEGKYGEYRRRRSSENILEEDTRYNGAGYTSPYRSRLSSRNSYLLDDDARKRAINQLLESTKKYSKLPTTSSSSEKSRLDNLVGDIINRDLVTSSNGDKYGSRYDRNERRSYTERASTPDRDYSSKYSVSPRSNSRYDPDGSSSTRRTSDRYESKYTRDYERPMSPPRSVSELSRSPIPSHSSESGALNRYRSPADDISSTEVDTKTRRSIYTRSYLSRDGEVIKDEVNHQEDVFGGSSRPELTTRVQRYPPADTDSENHDILYSTSGRSGEVSRWRDDDVTSYRGGRRVDEVIRSSDDSNVSTRIRRSDVDTSVNIVREVPVSRSVSAEEEARRERRASGMNALRNKIAALSKSVDDLSQYKNKSLLRSYVSQHEGRSPVEIKKDFPVVEKYEMKSKRVEPKDVGLDDIDYNKPDFAIPAGVRSPVDRVRSPIRSPVLVTPPITSPQRVTSPVRPPERVRSPEREIPLTLGTVDVTDYHEVGELGIYIPKQITMKGKKQEWWNAMTAEDVDKILSVGDVGWWNARTAEGVDTILGIHPSDKYTGTVLATYDTGAKPKNYIWVRSQSRAGNDIESQKHKLTRTSSHMYLDESNDGKNVELLIRVKSEESDRPRYVAVRPGPVERAIIVRNRSVSELPPYASRLAQDISTSEGVKLKDGFIKLHFKDMTPEFRTAWARIIGVEQKEILDEDASVDIPVNIQHTTSEPIYALPMKKRHMSAQLIQGPTVKRRPGELSSGEIELVAKVSEVEARVPSNEVPEQKSSSLQRTEGSAFEEVKTGNSGKRPQVTAKDSHEGSKKKSEKKKAEKRDSKGQISTDTNTKTKNKEKKFGLWTTKSKKEKEAKKQEHDQVDSTDIEVQTVLKKEIELENQKKQKKQPSTKVIKKVSRKAEKRTQQQDYDPVEVQRILLQDPYGAQDGMVNHDDKLVPNLYGPHVVERRVREVHHKEIKGGPLQPNGLEMRRLDTHGSPMLKQKIQGIGTPVSGSFSERRGTETTVVAHEDGDKVQALPRRAYSERSGSNIEHPQLGRQISDNVFLKRRSPMKYVTVEHVKSRPISE